MTLEEPTSIKHFGVTVRKSEYGYKLDRNSYATPGNIPTFDTFTNIDEDLIYFEPADKELKKPLYKDEHVEMLRHRAMENFDLNMAFIEHLDQNEYDEMLKNLLTKNKNLQEIYDLTPYNKKQGIYILELGQYKQLYVGQSTDIVRRIRTHWTQRVALDRAIFPDIYGSILSIKSFRALDTTRIFIVPSKRLDHFEKYFINAIPAKFRLNRIIGGSDALHKVIGMEENATYLRDLLNYENPS